MESHSDNDHGMRKALSEVVPAESIQERLASLDRRAAGMTLRRRNEITAGGVGEAVLYDGRHKGLLVRRLPDDPDGVLRLSLGEHPELGGAYMVIRGDPEAVDRLLSTALAALRRARANGL